MPDNPIEETQLRSRRRLLALISRDYEQPLIRAERDLDQAAEILAAYLRRIADLEQIENSLTTQLIDARESITALEEQVKEQGESRASATGSAWHWMDEAEKLKRQVKVMKKQEKREKKKKERLEQKKAAKKEEIKRLANVRNRLVGQNNQGNDHDNDEDDEYNDHSESVNESTGHNQAPAAGPAPAVETPARSVRQNKKKRKERLERLRAERAADARAQAAGYTLTLN